MHTVLVFKPGIDDGAVSAAMAEAGVYCSRLSSYYLGPAKQGLVLGFANTPTVHIRRHVDTIEQCLQRLYPLHPAAYSPQ